MTFSTMPWYSSGYRAIFFAGVVTTDGYSICAISSGSQTGAYDYNAEAEFETG